MTSAATRLNKEDGLGRWGLKSSRTAFPAFRGAAFRDCERGMAYARF
jgi:hypothetical protein